MRGVLCIQGPERCAESGAGRAGDEVMAGAEKSLDKQALLYCERGVELLTDLLSQLPTRRFVHTLLEDKAVLIKCKLSALHSHPQGAPRLSSAPCWVLNPPASECCAVIKPFNLRVTPDCLR